MTIFRTHFLFILAVAVGMATANISFATAPAGASSTAATSTQDKSPMMSRDEVVRILASNRKIVSPQGVDEMIKVRINGIDQWLSIRGKDRRNPILLFLHGGPASPAMPEAYTFQTPWEDYFTVVQWDQRGSGKTYEANTEKAMEAGMTVDGMTDDAAQVCQYLGTTAQKISAGTPRHGAGVHLAQLHPTGSTRPRWPAEQAPQRGGRLRCVARSHRTRQRPKPHELSDGAYPGQELTSTTRHARQGDVLRRPRLWSPIINSAMPTRHRLQGRSRRDRWAAPVSLNHLLQPLLSRSFRPHHTLIAAIVSWGQHTRRMS